VYGQTPHGYEFAVTVDAAEELGADLTVSEGGPQIASVVLQAHDEADGTRTWHFTLSPAAAHSSTFVLGRGRLFSVDAWIFDLGPLLECCFEPLNGDYDVPAYVLQIGSKPGTRN
jgi:hypothetical protein